MKRKPEQIHKLNQLLDEVVKIGHEDVRDCTCRKCQALQKYSIRLGFQENYYDPFAKQRVTRTVQRHKRDANILSKMIAKGKSIEEMMDRINHSRSYVHTIIREFNLNRK
jgi:hypothetical protein